MTSALRAAPDASDLHIPLPATGKDWHPQTIHTHYFGFQIPEQRIGAFIYVKYFPVLAMVQGGVSIYQGLDNHTALDARHLDFETAMPWPTVDGNSIETANGLRITFPEPGKRAVLSYRSSDRRASFDLEQKAITPLFFRGHIMPGEEQHHEELIGSGGSEQFMHCTGTVTLDGTTHAIDCYPARDRSWEQVRVERKVPNMPPIGWSPICFGPDFAFNQVGYESLETKPVFLNAFDIDPDKPAHHFGFIVDRGEARPVVKVDRNVLEHDPVNFFPLRQEIEATEEDGTVHRFAGEAIALCPAPSWTNSQAVDTVTRWTDAAGRVAWSSYQELWFNDFRHLMRGRQGTP